MKTQQSVGSTAKLVTE